MELVKKYAKAILAFLGVVVTNAWANLNDGSTPWPTNTAEWVRLVLTSVVGTLAVVGTPNKQDKGQVTTSLQKLPDEDAKEAVSSAYPTWNLG